MTTYETVAGTQPRPHVTHEARTIVRTDDDGEVYMMTEIGDGVFTQWGTCRKCNQRIKGCTCPEGPQDAEYVRKWREARFDNSLHKERPEPDRKVLDSVIDWLKERGYTVEKSVETQLAEAKPFSPDDPPAIDLTDEERDGLSEALDELKGRVKEPEELVPYDLGHHVSIGPVPTDEEDAELAKNIDHALDEAADRVREAKRLAEIDPGF